MFQGNLERKLHDFNLILSSGFSEDDIEMKYIFNTEIHCCYALFTCIQTSCNNGPAIT